MDGKHVVFGKGRFSEVGNGSAVRFDGQVVLNVPEFSVGVSPPTQPIYVCAGTVISGLDVVSAVEQVGSDSGRTRVPGEFVVVVIP